VEDILLIFDSKLSNIQKILDDFNFLHPKLQFTAESEKDNILNFLDISIHRTPTNSRTAIFRKPTFTDTIIPLTSIHPTNHKNPTLTDPYNRLDNYNLQQEEYMRELNVIHNTLHDNSFPIKPHKPPTHYPEKKGSSPRHTEMGKFHVRREGKLLYHHYFQADCT
jgi:hypothetical protein